MTQWKGNLVSEEGRSITEARPEFEYIHIRACPLCSSDRRIVVHDDVPDFRYHVPGEWSFVRCEDCGLSYLDPWLANPQSAYPEGFSQHRSATAPHIQKSGTLGSLKGWVRRGVLQAYGYNDLGNWATAVLGRVALLVRRLRHGAIYGCPLFPKAKHGGRVLDIGCGNGRFLAIMRMLGWDVYGIEPDQHSARLAKQLSEALVCPTLHDAGFSSEFFDLITMSHVLEHIGNPLQVLRECYPILKRGSRIGVCVPNWRAFSHRLFGKYWYPLDSPRHLVMYTPARLKMLVEQAGFAVESVLTTSTRQGKVSFQKSWRFKAGRPPPSILVATWGILSTLITLAHRKAGEEIVLWGVKR